MAIPRVVQLYFGASQILGQYGDHWEVRGGENWYLMKERGVRLNGEVMYVDRSPVGYTAYPYPGRRQGPGVPHQSRDQLLIDQVKMTRRPRPVRRLSSVPSSL